MTRLSVNWLTRNFDTPLLAPRLSYAVQDMTAHMIGGPRQMMLEVSGSEDALWETANLLRAPTTVRDGRQEPVWWGYASEVSIPSGEFMVGIRLDEMANRVAVAYTHAMDGGTFSLRETTPFAENPASIAEYGIKELLHGAAAESPGSALNLRDSLLEAVGLPVPLTNRKSGAGGFGRIYCRGWWDTLSWRYYSQTSGREAHEGGATTAVPIGGEDEREVAQSFSLTANHEWVVQRVQLRCQKIGAPTDALRLSICANNSGQPGTVLETADVDAANIANNMAVTTFEFDLTTLLQYGTTYWLVLARTGISDNEDYYRVSVDATGSYPNGALYYNDLINNNWYAVDPAEDLIFDIAGAWETNQQIEAMIADYPNTGFITGIKTPSTGQFSNQFRGGDTTTMAEIEALLRVGGANKRPLLAYIDVNRFLHVYEAPARPGFGQDLSWHRLRSNSVLEDSWGAPVPPEAVMTGMWVRLVDIIPATANLQMISDLSSQFIESAAYDGRSGKTFYTPRGRSNPLDISKLGGFYG